MRLLLIDKDREQSGWLADRLAGCGFAARLALSAEQVVANRMAIGAAALVLDHGLGSGPASPAVQTLRKGGICQPLVVLATRDDWRDRIECFDAGADDFLLKPVRSEEIAARLRAIIRRSAGQPTDRIQLGGLDLDLKARCAWLDGRCLNLTRNEFRLLRMFMLQPERVVAHADLLDHLNPGGARPTTNAAEVLIGRLRRKIGAGLITTVRGVGYQFSAGSAPSEPIERSQCLRGKSTPCACPEGAEVQ